MSGGGAQGGTPQASAPQGAALQGAAPQGAAAVAMDQMYRYQRHIYDVTRKYYLLGRDRLLQNLQAAAGTSVLEIGCGTGRNLIQAAKLYPQAQFYGIDISSEMLETARASIAKAGLSDRIQLAQGDATAFDPQTLFGKPSFERVFISYALSMIPPWQGALTEALRHVAPDGRLLLVDFGQAAGWPRWFQALLTSWLSWFHVHPRAELQDAVTLAAAGHARVAHVTHLYGGYAVLAEINGQRVDATSAPAVQA